jgi:hypothetical protein
VSRLRERLFWWAWLCGDMVVGAPLWLVGAVVVGCVGAGWWALS